MSKYLRPRDENRYFLSSALFQHRPHPLPGDEPHYARDRAVDIQHIKLYVAFDLDAKRVLGTAHITAIPINNGIKSIELDAVDLKINSVALADGASLKYQTTDNKMLISLPKPLDIENPFTVVIEYEATPQRGLYFIGPDEGYPNKPPQIWTQGEDEDSRYWFPCYDSPNDRFTSEMLITVPSSWWAISNGRLESVTDNQGKETKTFHWVQDKPHVTYLMTLCAGEFSRVSQGEVNGVPVEFYVPLGREEDGQRAFGNTPEMIKLFSILIGLPYPWAKYAQIAAQDFLFGGMENTSATTQTDLTLHDEKAHLDFSSDPLVSHELAHQWFGDLLTCRDWAHAWLNEGFATFFEAVWRENHLGIDEYRYDIYNMAREYISEDLEHYRRSIVSNVYRNPMDIFDRHLYEKGGLVLHMLRGILGDDLFWKAIRHYAAKHQNTNVITPDLQRAIEEATGKNLDWFFDQWVFKGGHPNFEISYEWDNETKSAKLTIKQTQQPDQLTSIYRIPANVAFLTSDGRQTFHIEVSAAEHTFHFSLTERPKAIQFDPGYQVVKTLDFDRPKEMLEYQAKHDDDIIGRIEAAEGLGKLGTADAVAILKDMVLNDRFWGVQAEAARSLGTIKSQPALDALIECAQVSRPKARRAVARALGEFRDEKAADTLLSLLRDDESYYVAAVAASSLGKTRSTKAYDALVQALDRDSHIDVIRSMAFEGLAELRDDRAISIALEWTKYGKPSRARESAVAALGKLGEEKRDVVDALIDLLDDPWLRMRTRTISALEELKETRAIPALERRIARDLDGRAVRLAREAIIKIRLGKSAPDDVKKLRESLDKLEDENRRLQDRLDSIEKRLDQKPS